MNLSNQHFEFANPIDIAKYLVYCEKTKKAQTTGRVVLLKNIAAKTVYAKDKTIFDKLFHASEEYGINLARYVEFYVFELGKTKKTLKEDFLSVYTLNKYVDKMEEISNAKKICGYLFKSANNIAKACLENNIHDCRKYFIKLATENLLAEKLVSGEISRYYFASMRNLDKLISKTDQIAKDEFRLVLERKDKLNLDAQNAFKKIHEESFSPIAFTNTLLKNNSTNNNIKQTKD